MPPQPQGQAPMPMGDMGGDPMAIFAQLPPDIQMMLVQMIMENMDQPQQEMPMPPQQAPAPLQLPAPAMKKGGEMQPGYAEGGEVADSMEDMHDKIAALKAKIKEKEQSIREKYAKKKENTPAGNAPPYHPSQAGYADGGEVPPDWWAGTPEEWAASQNEINRYAAERAASAQARPGISRSPGVARVANELAPYAETVAETPADLLSRQKTDWHPLYGNIPGEGIDWVPEGDEWDYEPPYRSPSELENREIWTREGRAPTREFTGITQPGITGRAGPYQGRLLDEGAAPMRTPPMGRPSSSDLWQMSSNFDPLENDPRNHSFINWAPDSVANKAWALGGEGMDAIKQFDQGGFGDPRSDTAKNKLISVIERISEMRPDSSAVRPGPLTPPRGTPSPHYPAFMSLSEAGGEGPTKLNPYLSYEPKDPAARGIPPGIHKHELEEGLSFEERAKARKNRAALRAELGLDYYGPDRVVREHPFKPETWSNFKDWAEKKNIQVKPWDNVNDMQYLYDHWAAENPDQYRHASVPRSPGPPSDALFRMKDRMSFEEMRKQRAAANPVDALAQEVLRMPEGRRAELSKEWSKMREEVAPFLDAPLGETKKKKKIIDTITDALGAAGGMVAKHLPWVTGVLTGEQLGQFSADAIRQAKIDPDATLAESLDRAQVKQLIAQHGNNLYDPEYRERMGLTQGDFALKHILFGGQSVGEAPGLKETGSYLPSRTMSMPEYLITNWPSDEGPIPKRLMSQVTLTAKQLDYPGLSSEAKKVVGYKKGGKVKKTSRRKAG